MNICKRELSFLVDSLSGFLKPFDKASKCIQIPLAQPKIEMGSTKWKDILFDLYYGDISEHPIRHIRSSFRLGNNSSFQRLFHQKVWQGSQFILTEIVDLILREINHLYKNRYYEANKCEITESNYDV